MFLRIGVISLKSFSNLVFAFGSGFTSSLFVFSFDIASSFNINEFFFTVDLLEYIVLKFLFKYDFKFEELLECSFNFIDFISF